MCACPWLPVKRIALLFSRDAASKPRPIISPLFPVRHILTPCPKAKVTHTPFLYFPVYRTAGFLANPEPNSETKTSIPLQGSDQHFTVWNVQRCLPWTFTSSWILSAMRQAFTITLLGHKNRFSTRMTELSKNVMNVSVFYRPRDCLLKQWNSIRPSRPKPCQMAMQNVHT